MNLKKYNLKLNKMTSLETTFHKAIDDVISNFALSIATKYKLNKDELLSLWKTTSVKVDDKIKAKIPIEKEVIESSDIEKPEFTVEELTAKKKAELQGICKDKKLKVTGKKEELIDRILSFKVKPVVKKSSTSSNAKTLLQSLNSPPPAIRIRRNTWGNYEHPEHHFVFDKVTEVVVGIQLDNGTVKDLDEESIELCNKYKYKYVLPDNLDKNTKSMTDIKLNVDEDEDDIIEDDDIEESEEELLEDDDDGDLEEFYGSDGEN